MNSSSEDDDKCDSLREIFFLRNTRFFASAADAPKPFASSSSFFSMISTSSSSSPFIPSSSSSPFIPSAFFCELPLSLSSISNTSIGSSLSSSSSTTNATANPIVLFTYRKNIVCPFSKNAGEFLFNSLKFFESD